MSIKRNSIANYIGQGYTILIAIGITPFYLKYLGAEAYGLVAFFLMLQAWMVFLDMGLSPTLGRQVAVARAKENGFLFLRRLLKSFELIFLMLSSLVIIGILFLSERIAYDWITTENLAPETAAYCISLMAVMIGIRGFAGLYRGGINGLEDQIWLNSANIIIASLKFIGALVLLMFISRDVRKFFEYQLIISVVEFLILACRFYFRLPATMKPTSFVIFDWPVVKSIAPFALSIAYTTGVWVLVTQSDKLILSGILSLSEFAYFSLVALVAGGITALSDPIAKAIVPRMTVLWAQDKSGEALEIYRQASKIVTVIAFSAALIIALYSETLLYAWSGDRQAASWGANVLTWFSLGNGVLAISAFQYYLQSTLGQLRLHVIGSTISAIIQVPIISLAAMNYGATGVGVAWFGFRVIWFLWWTPVVHQKFVPGFHWNWIFKDIMPIILSTSVLAWILSTVFTLDVTASRFCLLVQMAGLGMLLLCISTLSVPIFRKRFISMLASLARKRPDSTPPD